MKRLYVILVATFATVCLAYNVLWSTLSPYTHKLFYDARVSFYKSYITHSRSSGTSDCTLLMPTYKREKMLSQVLGHYCSKQSPLSKIVLVWSDPETPVPFQVLELKESCHKEMKIVIMRDNKLTNNHLPQNLDGIGSECIFFTHDDLIVSWQDLEFGMALWENFRHLLVGFVGRTRNFSILKNGSYFYGVPWKADTIMKAQQGSYGLMIPPYFMHKAYLEMFFDQLMVPLEYVEYIDTIMNCEDIMLSMMVTKFVKDANLQWTGGLAVEPQKQMKCLQFRTRQGLSGKPGHYSVRSECLQRFSQFLGEESLVLTQTVVKKSTSLQSQFVQDVMMDD